MSERHSLFLVGPRGAGKSSVGALAAKALGLSFQDSDVLVERQAGIAVAEIFDKHGAAAFRATERRILLRLCQEPGLLVASGGGSLEDPRVRSALASLPGVVWLDAPPGILLDRTRDSARPPLTHMPPRQELEWLVATREAQYRQVADLRIDTGSMNPDEVVDVIQHFWSSLSDHHLR